GEECRLVGDTQDALKLTREVRPLAILDQRGRTHRRRRAAGAALRAPGREQRLEDLRRERLLVEAEPDLDRDAPLLADVGRGVARDHVVEPERGDLPAGGGGGGAGSRPGRGARRAEHPPAWRRWARG